MRSIQKYRIGCNPSVLALPEPWINNRVSMHLLPPNADCLPIMDNEFVRHI